MSSTRQRLLNHLMAAWYDLNCEFVGSWIGKRRGHFQVAMFEKSCSADTLLFRLLFGRVLRSWCGGFCQRLAVLVDRSGGNQDHVLGVEVLFGHRQDVGGGDG